MGGRESRLSPRLRVAGFAIGFAIATAGCKADKPDLADGDGGFDGVCTPFADLLFSFEPAPGSSDAGDLALGEPDEQSVVLTQDAVLTLGFVGLRGVIEAAGDDIDIHATIGEGASAVVYVAGEDAVDFAYAATLSPDVTTIDIANASTTLVFFVQFVGQTGEISIDALEALQTDCTTSSADLRTWPL